MGKNSAGNRLAGIDGLRGVATLAVVIFHYDAFAFGAHPQQVWTWYGLMGVELFFVISGFVILMTIERTESIWGFAVRRFARLYPLYLVALLFAIPYGLYLVEGRTWVNLAVSLTLLQRFFGLPEVNIPNWTLGVEVWFYCLVAIVSAARLLRWVIPLCLLWLGIMLWYRMTGTDNVFVVRQFGHFFISGIALYRLYRGDKSLLTFATLALAVAYSALGRPGDVDGPAYLLGHVLFVAGMAVAIWRSTSILSSRPLVYLGGISYGVYLLNAAVGMYVKATTDFFGLPAWTFIPPACALTLGLSIIARKWIELPAQRLVIQWALSPRQGAAVRQNEAVRTLHQTQP